MTFVKRVTLAAATILLGAPLAAQAHPTSSLPHVPGTVQPGPKLLYAAPATSPVLSNTGPWHARPIMISGAEAYRQGEFLYQDFLYDDYGAAGTPDPNAPFTPVANLFSPNHGTLSYPTNTALYANNAADLLEFRLKPLADATAIRVTMNTMIDPSTQAFTVAIGDSPTQYTWPAGAGVSSPAQYFLTVHGTTAALTDAASGAAVMPAPTVAVDLKSHQFQVSIPHAAWNPGRDTVRMEMGTGLWDAANGTYLKPGPTATAGAPGGGALNGAAIFNLAFRTHEPVPKIYSPGIANSIVEGGALVKQDGSWWRERDQADALAGGDVSQFNAMVDFAKLSRGANDDSGVPKTGDIDRLYVSRFKLGEGVDYPATCLGGTKMEKPCTGRLLGQIQPYALYVPDKPIPSRGFGLTVSMHGLSANYNEFLGSHEALQIADRGTGSIFASPEGRGPDSSWKDYGEADVFEMWADIARHYRLNPGLTDVTGYSMGGGGTYQLGSQWPDLWARAFPIVGPPTTAASFMNLRNIPVLAWYGQNDELVGPGMSEQAFVNALQAGIRYDHWLFTPAGHITEGNNDAFAPAAAFLGSATVDRDPTHVTYMYDPATDDNVLNPADHAYWLSAIKLASPASAGTLDVRSLGTGQGDPLVSAPTVGYNVLTGGSHGPLPYQERNIAWSAAPPEAKADELVINAKNVSAVTIDARRAGVSCHAKVDLVSDGTTKVSLADCPRPGGTRTRHT